MSRERHYRVTSGTVNLAFVAAERARDKFARQRSVNGAVGGARLVDAAGSDLGPAGPLRTRAGEEARPSGAEQLREALHEFLDDLVELVYRNEEAAVAGGDQIDVPAQDGGSQAARIMTDVIRAGRDRYPGLVEKLPRDREGRDEVGVGHEGSPSAGDGQATTTPDVPVVRTVAGAVGTGTPCGAGGGAAGSSSQGPAAPNAGEAS